MIDIHCHILPGLDDGAKNMEETLGVVRQLSEVGFRTLIATPHVLEGKDFLCPEKILAATEQVCQEVAAAGIPVQILPGAENYIFPNMAEWAGEGKLLTLGNTRKYILVELSILEIPRYTEKVFFELQVKGFIPILAHPERYQVLAEEPERLLDWARKGILFQLDLLSLSGRYGSKAHRLAELMLRSDLVHFIGSDAHDVVRSELSYQKAFENIKEIVGEKKYQELVVGNAQDALEGKFNQGTRDFFLNKFTSKKKGFWDLFR